MKWTSAANNLSVTENKSLSFCPGSFLNGTVQPYLVGTMAPNSCLCQSILTSIANPKVFYLALHTSLDTGIENGLNTFPRSIL